MNLCTSLNPIRERVLLFYVHRYTRQRSRKTVKLTLASSGRNPSKPICSVQSSKRPKPPTYLFSNQSCQRARDKFNTARAKFARNRKTVSIHHHLSAARPSLLRFGEVLFRPRLRGTQEDSLFKMTVFSQCPFFPRKTLLRAWPDGRATQGFAAHFLIIRSKMRLGARPAPSSRDGAAPDLAEPSPDRPDRSAPSAARTG